MKDTFGDGLVPEHGLRIALWLGLDNKKCLEKLKGLETGSHIHAAVIFRSQPIAGLSLKFKQVVPPLLLRGLPVLCHLYALLMTMLICPRFKPHICISISMIPHALLAKLGSLFSRSRFVVWFIGTDMYRHLQHPLVMPLLPMLQCADSTMVMGNTSQSVLVKKGWPAKRVLIGHNAYDLRGYHPVDRAHWQWDLIFTGRLLRKTKGLDVLLQALHMALPSCPDLRCAIVGDGPDRTWLERHVHRLRLDSHVFFVGRKEQIAPLLQASKVFILTSAWEGLPASLVEAFACGIPAIAAKVGDIETIASHRYNSLVVADHSPHGYARAIILLLTDEVLRSQLAQGAIATGNILRQGSLERSVQAWENMFSVVMRRR